MTSTTSKRAASVGSAFDHETRAHLQRRLRLVTGVVGIVCLVLWIVFLIDQLVGGAEALPLLGRFLFRFPHVVLTLLWVVGLGLHVVLRRTAPSMGGLIAIDAGFAIATYVPCVAIFHLLPWYSFTGYPIAVTFLVLFVLARAVLVPSGAWSTLLISAPAPLAILASQLARGATYAFPDQPYSSNHYVDMLVQHQIVLWGAVAVATVASRVNASLRRDRYDARRIGQYDLQRVIGRGAMGEVHEATHALLKRPTAIKMIRPDRAGEAAIDRFEREVRNTSRLRHPNTVIVYDYGRTADGVFYYAMERLDGSHLRDVVDTTGPFGAARTIHVLDRVCAALEEAHGLQLVHRDVKPENVMLCEQGGEFDVVKLLDFGLVREIGRHGNHEIAGTPETMAPEIARGDPPSPVSDLYSLGVVGWFLLTGQRLFDSDSTAVVLDQHATFDVDLSRLPASVPRDLCEVLETSLRKQPRGRFASAAAMRAALRACADAGRWTASDAESWWIAHRAAIGRAIDSDIESAATTVLPPS